MRKITIYQKKSSAIEILDNSDSDIDKYCKDLSELFKMSNISILKTSEKIFIGRPGEIIGVTVEDIPNPKDPEIIKKESFPPEDSKSKHEDIITDAD